MTTAERQLEDQLIEKLRSLKYECRSDIRDRAALEKNFRQKFEALNHVHLTDGEFQRLLDEIITPDVFTAAKTVRSINAFTRDDGTPLNYTLVNIKDWCKNHFEVINQLRINTDYRQAQRIPERTWSVSIAVELGDGLKDVLPGPARLYASLRGQSASDVIRRGD